MRVVPAEEADTSCDTLVILGTETRDGHTLFAKNSDRPPTECQPLFQAPRRRHPARATVRCQYLEIPQVAETLAVIGSRPWWLWGFEHGVNECRVAIGNEALHAREAPGPEGLLGMDLVRLGLERGRTAYEALRVITDLLARHGQGGSASVDSDRRYHNGFIIADPAEAWILETCGRHWAAKRVRGRGAISNVYAIEDDWDAISDGVETLAAGPGGAAPDGDRLNFRRTVENPDLRYRAEARLAASCRFLAEDPPPGVASLMRHLRDHHEGGTIHVSGRRDGDPLGWSVCMHPNPGVSATAASLIAELPGDPAVPVTLWCSMGTPCTGAFIPLPFGEPLPDLLTHGMGCAGQDSLWWIMKALGDVVMADPVRLTPVVQAHWQAWEAGLLADWARDRRGIGGRIRERVEDLVRRRQIIDAELRRIS
jgi:dipeptidase